MIDIENEMFGIISKKIRGTFPKVFIAGEYVKAPSSFPCVLFLEADNQIYDKTSDSGTIENHAQVLYTVEVFSNKKDGKKSEAKKILNVIDTEMEKLGLRRIMMNPIPNEQDTIYRLVARYKAIVSKEKVIGGK